MADSFIISGEYVCTAPTTGLSLDNLLKLINSSDTAPAFGADIVITKFGLSLTSSSGSKDYSMWMSALVTIGNVQIGLDGDYEKSSGFNFAGYAFDAAAGSLSITASFQSFSTAVANKLNVTTPVTPSKDFSFSTLNVSLDSHHNFSFHGKVDATLTLGDVLQRLGVSFTGSASLATFTGFDVGINYQKAPDGSYSFKLLLKVTGNVTLNELLDLNENLFTTFNPALNEIDIEVDLDGSGGTKTSQYLLTTSFTDGASNSVNLEGVYTTSKTGTILTSVFGGRIYSPDGHTIDFGAGGSPIAVELTDLFIAKLTDTDTSVTPPAPTSTTIVGSDLAAQGHIDLSTLPVVGDLLKAADFSFNAIRIVSATSTVPKATSISATDLAQLNGFLGLIDVAPLLTAQSPASGTVSTPVPFPLGYSFQGSLTFGADAQVIPMHSSYAPAATGSTPAPAQSPPTPTPVGKKFGPITIDSVSLGLSGGDIDIGFSGGLVLGPIGFQLIGFEITSPTKTFSPTINIQGMSLSITKPPLTLAGMFDKTTVNVSVPDGSGGTTLVPVTEYNGSLSVGYNEYGLFAEGSYAKLPDGATSLFLYGFLGAPIGGLPVILFITGVAAGFGYNRTFALPTPQNINTYPLIQPVMPGAAPTDFSTMSADFLPQENAFWGAIGLRVESFKMIETFVLLDVQFDNGDLEIDIIGLANMQFPVPDVGSTIPPLAKILIGLVARILPQQGVVAVNGAFLAGSYIYVPEAQISGGFALLSIFKDQADGQWAGASEGDFIVTMGGYATNYAPKSYYPSVPRLELNWTVSDSLSINAQSYFAITPQAMMAGGYMVGNFEAGGDFSIHVTFSIGADFIVYWKPYHYSATFSADLSVTARIDVLFIHQSIDFDLGADLGIWGPSFSGHASVHVHILVSFTVSVSFGDDESVPDPIGWDDFKSGFLPADDKTLTCTIATGLVPASAGSGSVNRVNAKDMSFVCGSAIPFKGITGVAFTDPSFSPAQDFGIKPMGIAATDFATQLNITFTEAATGASVTPGSLLIEPLTKNMPSALWQPASTPGVIPANDGTDLLNGLLNGVRISAGPPATAGAVVVTGNPEDDIYIPQSAFAPLFDYSGFNLP